ncbi:MAG TPA: ATP-dependent DNA helicase [Methylophaga aminisulfidivorans]|uniref:ATP-dependent DNA helicase n=1 Tax=Methylophaga aminisulfidivorans TaxID=230105 RepID=A0A7C1W3V8_9GAMM|nr:ATP-dependent DNA helicase [Methylophaga aminisulfidivorans]
MSEEINTLFTDGGLLSKHITGYKSRVQQIEMAQKVADALAHGDILIAEAGTGTGKTYAYLAPAILSGQKVFISTGTKNLQDQLFTKDLPKLREVLSAPIKTALLKGRSNYLCHHRLTLSESEPSNSYHQHTLQNLREWSGKTKTGDLGESDLLEENSPLWPKVTSTVDNCLGQQCPDYDECFILEARRRAQEADLVVVNHHLLMSDMALKASGQGEVLPDADAYIIDEAHQLPAIASQFLGYRVSHHQIQELSRDSIREMEVEATDMNDIRQAAEQLENRLHQFTMSLGDREQRLPWHPVIEQSNDIKEKLDTLIDYLERLEMQLEIAAERGKGIEQCHLRCTEIVERLSIFQNKDADNDLVLWIDNRGSSFILHATPQEVSQYFQQWIKDKPQSWVFTSATLTVAGKFNNFISQLGLEDPITASWQSPFDYGKQSLLYMPNIALEPSNYDYNSHVAEVAKSVIELSKGRTFLLFTSYKAMNEVAEALKDSDYPILVQGSGAKAQLLDEFRSHGNAVLLGTNSFWEGVDVRGEALSCVLIDKIPFASPGDPVLEARINDLKERGGNPFRSIQIPSAVIQLKQGIGRLIRDTEDSGVLVLCDPRFLSKPYGKVFLRSLPPMPITQNLEDVDDFFKSHQ